MAKVKTTETEVSVDAYIEAIADETRREDCRTLLKLMSKATKAEPKMWGTSIVGFGNYHYKYASGREGDTCLTGFASGKPAISIYLACGAGDQFTDILATLGKHKMGKGCLYVSRLADVDRTVLAKLIKMSIEVIKRRSKEAMPACAQETMTPSQLDTSSAATRLRDEELGVFEESGLLKSRRQEIEVRTASRTVRRPTL